MKRKRVVLISLAVLACSLPASAAILLPGDTAFPDLFSGAAGTLLASSSQAFTTATYSATLGAAVFRTGAGTLDFYYQLANTSSVTQTGQIARTTDFSFAGFSTDVGFRLDGGSVSGDQANFVNGTKAPITVDRNGGVGDVIGFSFNPPDSAKVLRGETSRVLVIKTNATNFTTGTTSVIDGGTRDLATFAPTGTVIPEPMSVLLMGSGLLAVGVLRRLKKIRNS